MQGNLKSTLFCIFILIASAECTPPCNASENHSKRFLEDTVHDTTDDYSASATMAYITVVCGIGLVILGLVTSKAAVAWVYLDVWQVTCYVPLMDIKMEESLRQFTTRSNFFNLQYSIWMGFFDNPSYDPNDPYQRITDGGFDSSLYLINIGFILMLGMVLGVIHLVIYCRKTDKHDYLMKTIWPAIWLRFVLVTYLPACVATFIQLADPDEFDGVIGFNFIIAVFSLIILAAIPLAMFLFLANYGPWTSKEQSISVRYQGIIQELKKKSTFSNALYYPVFHCIRKFLYALFIVTIDNGVAVSILCFLLALPGLLYVAIWQPFKSWSLNAGRIVSEAGLFIIFTVLIYSGADVTVKGWGIIFVILLLESILTCVCIFTSLKIEPSERVGDYSTNNVDITDQKHYHSHTKTVENYTDNGDSILTRRQQHGNDHSFGGAQNSSLVLNKEQNHVDDDVVEQDQIDKDEEALRQKLAEEEALRQKLAEEEALRQQQAEEEALRQQQAEEEALRQRQAEEEALRQRQAEEEALRQKQAEEEALRQRQAEEEALRQQQAEEEALRQKQAEEEALRQKQAEEEALRQKQAEEEALRQKQAEEEALRQKQAEEEALRQRQAEEEALRQKQAEEEALRQRKAEEEALRQKQAEEEALRQKQAEEEALRQRKAEEEALRQKQAEEEALRQKQAEEEALRQRKAEEEALRKAEEERKRQLEAQNLQPPQQDDLNESSLSLQTDESAEANYRAGLIN